MKYFLDTNTCIYALKGTFPRIEERIARLSPELIKIPSMVKAELLLGAEKSSNPARVRQVVEQFFLPYEIVPFCGKAAEEYARIRSGLEIEGRVIGPNDLIIAATVLTHEGTLVTHNTEEFKRVKRLKLRDWTR